MNPFSFYSRYDIPFVDIGLWDSGLDETLQTLRDLQNAVYSETCPWAFAYASPIEP